MEYKESVTGYSLERVLSARAPAAQHPAEGVDRAEGDARRPHVQPAGGEVTALRAREGHHALRREREADPVSTNHGHGHLQLRIFKIKTGWNKH